MSHHVLDSGENAMTVDANRLAPRATSIPAADRSTETEPVNTLRAFIDGLDRLGYDVASLLARAGLRRTDLADPDAMIPCVALDQVLRGACEEQRVPNLGARLAAVTPIGAFPLLDYLVLTTNTVEEALEQVSRYFHIVAAPCTLTVVSDQDWVRLVVSPGSNVFIAQYETSIAIHRLRAETNNALRVTYVSLMREPEDLRDLERLLGCSVQAPSTWSGVEFPRETLQTPLRRRDPALRGVLEGHAATVAPLSKRANVSIVDTVRDRVASQLGRGVPDIDTVARQLAMATRTLQRRLAAEGVSYQQVVDLARRDAAELLLADASLAVSHIGYLLGFSEASAFHRAFKRWHAVTPQEFRRSHAGLRPGEG